MKNIVYKPKKLIIFGGTSEEHLLLRALSPFNLRVTLQVASAYGKSMAPDHYKGLTIRAGRLTADEMAGLMREDGFFCAVDATHPYAVEVTKNIRAATAAAGIPYLRLLREKSAFEGAGIVESVREAVGRLNRTDGNALLTTGSKELSAFTAVRDYRTRLFPRVLPTAESVGACLSNGFPANHIIAMHGPFSKELNIALMRQFYIQTIVTKDGGAQGGFPEKLEAARELNVDVIVIRRPAEDGLTLAETVAKISEFMEEGI